MSTFFQQTAQAMIAKHIDRFPLLKSEGDVFEPVESGQQAKCACCCLKDGSYA